MIAAHGHTSLFGIKYEGPIRSNLISRLIREGTEWLPGFMIMKGIWVYHSITFSIYNDLMTL